MTLDFIVALPEILLLAGACALVVVDLFVKDGNRKVSLALAQGLLLIAAAATLFVLLGTGGELVYAFGKLYVADVMAHVLKLAAYASVSVALV